jgi:nucleoid DNA-binding protein
MRANRETERLLRLVGIRASGLLHSLLRSSDRFREKYLTMLSNSEKELDFEAKAGELLMIAIREPGFVLSLAHRATHNFASTFWVELPEWLVEEERCTFQNFGIFAVVSRRDHIQITFDSRLSLDAAAKSEPVEPSGDSGWLMSKIVHEETESIRAQTFRAGQSSAIPPWQFPLVFSEVLSLTLYDSLRRIVEHTKSNAFVAEFPNGWFGLLGMAIAIASYYGFETVIESELCNGRQVGVDRIGIFRAEGSRVTFLAAVEFTNMLAANLKMKVE